MPRRTSGPPRVAAIAEGQPDVEIIVAMAEMLACIDGPQWLREHLDGFGSLEGVLEFIRPVLTWSRLPQRAEHLRIRIRRRGEGPFQTELVKALAVLECDFPQCTHMVHRDHDSVSAVEAASARVTCSALGAILALPSPASEAWVLQAIGLPVPATTKEAKAAVGMADLSTPEHARDALRRSHPGAFDADHGGAALIDALRELLRSVTGGGQGRPGR